MFEWGMRAAVLVVGFGTGFLLPAMVGSWGMAGIYLAGLVGGLGLFLYYLATHL